MKFAARDGMSSRTLAYTASPSTRTPSETHAAPGWFTGAQRVSTPATEERTHAERPRVKPTTQNVLRGQAEFDAFARWLALIAPDDGVAPRLQQGV